MEHDSEMKSFFKKHNPYIYNYVNLNNVHVHSCTFFSKKNSVYQTSLCKYKYGSSIVIFITLKVIITLKMTF